MSIPQLSLLLSFFIFMSCSSKERVKVSPDEYLRLNALHASRHQLCIEQKIKILEPAIKESENPDLDDENYYFIRNEKKALTFMNEFDVQKFTLKENRLEFDAIIDGCVSQTHPNHQVCDTLLPAFKFFRGLIHGMNQYQWSKSTIQKGTQITMSYIQYVAHSNSSLMDILFANDLLMRLSQRGYIDKKIYSQTTELRKTGEKAFKKLKNKVQKYKKKKLSCVETQNIYHEEKDKVKELSEEFQKIIVTIQVPR